MVINKIKDKKKIDLTQFFDSLEFDDDLVKKLENWTEFEREFGEKTYLEKEKK